MTSEEAQTSAGSGGSRKHLYLGITVSILCIAWVLSSVEGDEVLGHIRDANYFLLFTAALTTFLSYLIRSWRWPFFFERNAPGLSDSFRCLITGFFMNNILPARMGELIRAHLGGRATNQSRSVVLATVAAERLADGLVISLLFAILFSTYHVGAEQGAVKEMFLVAYLFLAVGLFTACVLVWRQRIFRILRKLGDIMPGHFSSYTLLRIEKFIQGLEPLLVPKRVFILLLISVGVWLVELFVYFQIGWAFGVELTLGSAVLFLAAVNFSSLIPAAPGAIGVIEAFATMALVRIGLDKETAFAMVVLQHGIQYLVVGLPGTYFFFSRLGGRIPVSPDDENEEDESGVAKPNAFADVSEPRPLPREQQQDPLAELSAEELDKATVDVSVIIPAYNEEQRLPQTLLSVTEYLKGREGSFEVLVVDDGSQDGTAKVVTQFEKLSDSVRLLGYPNNRGKGFAVKFGMLNARGALMIYNDADGASPIEEMARLEAAIADGAQVAIGSRAMYSRETKVATVWYRKCMGRVFNGLVNVLLLPGIADTQCGFKMFERSVGRRIFSKQKEEGFAFDVEILFLARKYGCKIAEVPINWTNIPGSKVRLVHDSMGMFLDIVKIRLRDVLGGYAD